MMKGPASLESPRRILVVHNRYQQTGGEDVVFEEETRLLEGRGHHVARLVVDNDDIPQDRSALISLRLAASTVWSRAGAARVRAAVREAGADIVHFHNTFPLISPAAYSAARSEGAAVVQTLHNYRLLCPSANFYREGRPCEDCLHKPFPWPGIRHACYRGSRTATATTAAMLGVHHGLRTWTRQVDAYVALTEFGKEKFVEGGLPAEKIHVKPNFLNPDPELGSGRGNYAIFVGRLVHEKGITTLIEAWRQLEGSIPLKIVGDGPMAEEVKAAAATIPGIEWLGLRPASDVFPLIADAAFLVFPSQWYEGFGLAMVEAMAVGTPVVASDLGAMQTVVEHGRTGLLFAAGDSSDLTRTVKHLWSAPEILVPMRHEARRCYERWYTADQNYRMLMDIYDSALRCRVSRRAA